MFPSLNVFTRVSVPRPDLQPVGASTDKRLDQCLHLLHNIIQLGANFTLNLKTKNGSFNFEPPSLPFLQRGVFGLLRHAFMNRNEQAKGDFDFTADNAVGLVVDTILPLHSQENDNTRLVHRNR